MTTFETIRSEGGLLPPDLLARIALLDKDLPGLKPEDYRLAEGERFSEAISRAWARLLAAWRSFQIELAKVPEDDPATTATRERFLQPLLVELGFGRVATAPAIVVDDRSYAISHAWGSVPIHLLGARVSLEKKQAGLAGAARSSPHGLVQDLLNRSEPHLWALLSNGLVLRLLRDHHSLTTQAYVEIDLEAMFEEQRYADFVVLWLICHQSRFDAPKLADCWLERWFGLSRDEGVRALDDLRDGVERAIEALGAGFLRHPHNAALVRDLAEGTLNKQDYYRELLRLVYRLIFLFSAEDREVLLDPKAPEVARHRYQRFYATRQLRDLAGSLRGGPHGDLWDRLRIVMSALDEGSPALGLPALGSFLWSREALPHLGGTSISNSDLLGGIRALSYIERDHQRVPIAWRTVAADELGSIYEGLLELHPRLDARAGSFELETAAGNDRKKTGSYYTPTSLVDCLLDSALDPVIDAAVVGKKRDDAVEALLALKIVDPACGSGHFLVAAARRMARRLASIRSGDDEPSPPELRHAIRDVVGRCVYGVDLNEMAVELCKVALWMEAVEPGKPLSFLDAHIQHGNALIGATPTLIAKGIPDDAWDPIEGDDKGVARALKKRNREARKHAQGTMWDDFAAPGTNAELSDAARDALAGADDALADVRERKRRWDSLQSSRAFRDAVFVADTWCAALVWNKQEGPLAAEAPTEEVFARIRREAISATSALRHEVHALALRYTFFHWHLGFPDVFVPTPASNEDNAQGRNGGFDCVIGNPPWERLKIQPEEYFANLDPEVAAATTAAERDRSIERLETTAPELFMRWRSDLRTADASSAFFRRSAQYPESAHGDLNTYPLFAEQCRALLAPRGRCGVVLPQGIVTDKAYAGVAARLAQQGRLISVRGFINEELLFPAVQHNVKFCVVTFGGSEFRGADPRFCFHAHTVEDSDDPTRWYSLSWKDVELLNPESLTFPILDPLTVPVIRDAYRAGSLLSEASWGLSFGQTLHTGGASRHFAAWDRSKSLVPLFESKMIDRYNHRAGSFEHLPPGTRAHILPPVPTALLKEPRYETSPCYGVPRAAYSTLAPDSARRAWHLAYCRITNVDVERTVAAAVLPDCALADSLMELFPADARVATLALAVLNSLAFDFLARGKLGGRNLSQYVFQQLAAPPNNAFDNLAPWCGADRHTTAGDWLRTRAVRLTYTAESLRPFAADAGITGDPWTWEPHQREILDAEIDAAVMHLYGFPREYALLVLDHFRVLREREQREHGEYRTRRLVLERYDALAAAIASGRAYESPLAAESQSGPAADKDKIAALRAAIATKEATRVQTDDVPYYEDLAVAAGQFDISQLPHPNRKISIVGSRSFERRSGVLFFVAPTRGRSMEPLIRDGDLCVYERSASSATGAIVLVQRARVDDGEGGRFVVKERGDGDPPIWRSRNPEYPNIVADPADVIVARWVETVRLVDGDPPATTPAEPARAKRGRRG